MEQSRFPYRIERTRNRHSRAVIKDGTIVVRLARNLTKREERTHVQDLLSRMKTQLKLERKKIQIDPFRPLLTGASTHTITLASEQQFTFSLTPKQSTGARKVDDGWEIRVGPALKKSALHRLLWRKLSEAKKAEVENLVQQINDSTLKVGVKNVRVRIATSQWGSCSSNGTIALNTALLFVQQDLLEYVIIHELAHRKCPHHSARFWSLVESVCPWYTQARKALREYRLPTL